LTFIFQLISLFLLIGVIAAVAYCTADADPSANAQDQTGDAFFFGRRHGHGGFGRGYGHGGGYGRGGYGRGGYGHGGYGGGFYGR
jgi:hypothetical protein